MCSPTERLGRIVVCFDALLGVSGMRRAPRLGFGGANTKIIKQKVSAT